DLIAQNRAGVANRDVIVLPSRSRLFHAAHHSARRQRRTGIEPPRFLLAVDEKLHVSAAHIDHQHLHSFLPTTAASTRSIQPAGSSRSRPASAGPQVPGSYSYTGVALSRTAFTIRHCASIASSRANRDIGRAHV